MMWKLYWVPMMAVMLGLTSASLAIAQPVASKTDLSSVGSNQGETSLGDVVADALRSASDADMAFVPSSAIRSETLPSAGLTTNLLSDSLLASTAPSNAYVTLRLKGKQIISALERSVSRLPQSFDGFLQVSGIKVVYDPNRPEGNRIVSVTLPDGTLLAPDSQYIAAMTQPLGIGGMGYFQAWNQSDVIKTSDDSVGTILTTYVLAHQPLVGSTDGRLKSQ